MERIEFTNSKNEKLVGLVKIPKKMSSAVIYAHGFNSGKFGHKSKWISKLINNKILFSFDFYGNGESEGKIQNMTLTEEIDDLKNAIDYVTSLDKFNGDLAVIGTSFGGLVSVIQAARDKRITRLALIAPALSSVEEYRNNNTIKEKNMKEKFYTDLGSYDAFNEASNITCPTIIIHGSADESVKVEVSKKLSRAIPDNKLIICNGGDHRFSKRMNFIKMILNIRKFIGEQK